MSFFSRGANSERFGVIIDIGSGSALAAIVHSEEGKPSPTVVWHAREHAPLKNIESTAESAKAVTNALINALLRLDGEGRQVLSKYRNDAEITHMQCSISAPWSYTVTKNINYKQEDTFKITSELLEELVRSAREEVSEEMQRNESVSQLGLVVVAQTTMSLYANGYAIKKPNGSETKDLSLVHGSVVTQEYLVDSLDDMRQKLFQKAEMEIQSYILTLFCTAKDLLPNLNECALVDVTYEASEIGIVRDGSLTYSTHTPFGLFSLAREFSAITKAPLHESFKALHTENPYGFFDSLTESKKEDAEKVLEAYIERLSELFHETGDELSIPRKIILNTESGSETLIKDLIQKAAKRAVKSEVAITLVSEKLLAKKDGEEGPVHTDVAMLVAARFFHKRDHCLTLDYL